MAGMRAKRTGTKVTYTFSGDLQEVLKKAKKELKEKGESQERVFLQWQKDKAVKACDNYERRIADLQDFIPLAVKELRERKVKEEAAGEKQ
jgi:predicted RNase H-like nuclease